ncbi:MAG: ABC transporter permease subunit [bacterium]
MAIADKPTEPPHKAWGDDHAAIHRRTPLGWVDAAVVLALSGVLFGLLALARDSTAAYRPTAEISLSPAALPVYTLLSLARGLVAYGCSLGFTLVYGYWAAKDHVAERVLVPLLDILQSIPVLGFMPGAVLGLVALFPRSNLGLELAAVLMIFTGQAWNMTFSYYHSLRSIPTDLREVAEVYQLGWWRRLRRLELPFATMGLVWNSMMSMAGGWFFLMVSESFVLGDKDFRLPGIGSYMSLAVARGNVPAMLAAIVAMVMMIVALDQILWRPVVVWAQRFRVEESAAAGAPTSWFLDLVRRSTLVRAGRKRWRALRERAARRPRRAAPASAGEMRGRPRLLWTQASRVTFVAFLALLALGGAKLGAMLWHVKVGDWIEIGGSAGLTLLRVLAATAIGTLWAVPAGLVIGLSPRLANVLQPVVQVVASFPAPMLFPLVIALLAAMGVSLGWGSIVLMLLGTQWYILFNVVAGAMGIPSDLREAAASFGIRGWLRARSVLLPAIFPQLVTGWVTAAGGAWNASIVAEYVTFRGKTLTAPGLGSMISSAAERADFPRLAAAVAVMALVVVVFNRNVWRRLYQLAETRYR